MINNPFFVIIILVIKMKAIIASDIHGNLEYTKKLYELCEKIDPDQIILLGDLLNNYYLNDYFEVNEIVTLLNRWSVRTIGVRGNTDRDNDLERLLFPIYDTYTEIDLDNAIKSALHKAALSDGADILVASTYEVRNHIEKDKKGNSQMTEMGIDIIVSGYPAKYENWRKFNEKEDLQWATVLIDAQRVYSNDEKTVAVHKNY